MEAYTVLKTLLLPPGLLLVLLAAAFLLVRGTLGRLLLFVSWSLLLLMSLPVTSALLLAAVQTEPPLTPDEVMGTDAGAIVILGAGAYKQAVEYGGTTVDPNSMKRSRYGAWLHRRTGLPIYVTGGRGAEAPGPAMVRFIEDELGVPVAELEDQSRTTWENASMTAPLLRNAGIGRVLLVTDAWHMPRSVAAFERVGIEVVPAPTYFIGDVPRQDPGATLLPQTEWSDWLPQAAAFYNSFYAIHELFGALYYELKSVGVGTISGSEAN